MGFLTPLGGAAVPGPAALLWFPVVGGLIGAGVGAAWWAAGRAWPVGVAAAVAVVVDLGLTGLLHFDGLCDSADGLLPPLPRERRLAVMAGPEIGAFAVAVAGVTLLLRWTALASIRPSTAPSIRLIALIAALWMASRTWMAVAVVVVPYARSSGLASAFQGRPAGVIPVGVISLCASGALAAIWRPVVGPAAVAAATLAAGGVLAFAWRRIGGFTGDVLGAAGVVGETIGLLAACARW
jgi:adenosylcobinamide-GDP ribazoletransferase